MRASDFISENKLQNPTTNYKLWSAPVRIKQPNYVGYIEAAVTAPNIQIARAMFKSQFGVQDWDIGSIKEVK
jgi:hypothetical protein